ncbi:MAG TPA: MCP four helix bundle domain-containing protein [Terriglobales bacterium]|nr:MCP four helix bundle domain-containing protein [Terriglobales bacterium]
MKWFHDLKIATKLLAGFILVAVIAGMVGFVGYSAASKIATGSKSMYDNQVVMLRNLGDANVAFLTARLEARKMLSMQEASQLRQSEQAIEEQDKRCDEALAAYLKAPLARKSRRSLPHCKRRSPTTDTCGRR